MGLKQSPVTYPNVASSLDGKLNWWRSWVYPHSSLSHTDSAKKLQGARQVAAAAVIPWLLVTCSCVSGHRLNLLSSSFNPPSPSEKTKSILWLKLDRVVHIRCFICHVLSELGACSSEFDRNTRKMGPHNKLVLLFTMIADKLSKNGFYITLKFFDISGNGHGCFSPSEWTVTVFAIKH